MCFLFVPGFIGKITLQIPFYRPHSDPWVISMSQLNLIIGPAQLQEYDDEKEKEEERQRKQRLLKAYEDKFKASGKQQETPGFIFRRVFVCCSCSNVHGEDALDITARLVSYRVKVNREGSLTGILSLLPWLPGL